MKLNLNTWDGNNINDGTNLEAAIIGKELLPGTSAAFVERANTWSSYATMQFGAKTLPIGILIQAQNAEAQRDNLRKWFGENRDVMRTLVATNPTDSSQWYVKATVEGVNEDDNSSVVVILKLDEPYWRKVTPVTDNWTITASGQTHNISVGGNVIALPIFNITANNAKTKGFVYRYWVRNYNPNAAAERNKSIDVTNGGINTATLVADTSKSNQINNGAGITAGALTIAIDTAVGGGLSTGEGICYVDTEQIHYLSISAGTMTVDTNGRGYAGTTAATHADNAVMKQSRCRADGADIRVYNKGRQLDRWLDGMNTATTKIWTEGLDYAPKIEMTLSGTISNSGVVSSLTLKDTPTNKSMLKRLPNRQGLIEIDSGGGNWEVFVYLGKDGNKRQVTLGDRAARPSSVGGATMATHADGATIRFLQYDLWLFIGNYDLITPEVDATKQPAWDTNSTNASHIYTGFGDKDGLRPGAWHGSVLISTGKKTRIYTGNHGDESADPITDMGLKMKTRLRGGIPQAENATLEFRLDEPGGITTVTSNGERYRIGTSWPETTGLQKSKGSDVWEDQFILASPSAANSWADTWSKPSESLGAGYKSIRFVMDGSLKAKLNWEADLEVDAVTVVLTNPIVVTLGAQQNNYELDCGIENVTTGDILYLKWTMATTEPLTVDSKLRKITYKDGTNAYRARSMNTKRIEYLPFKPGVTNQLKFTDLGTANLTLQSIFEERMYL
jgi:hypothetical protein